MRNIEMRERIMSNNVALDGWCKILHCIWLRAMNAFEYIFIFDETHISFEVDEDSRANFIISIPDRRRAV